jgi:hypothetical protein
LKGIVKETFDARFKVIYRRIDKRDDQHFLVTSDPAFVDDLRRQR